MKPQVIFGVSILVTMIALLIGWRQDPSFNRMPTPGMTTYFAVFGFVMMSFLIFAANLILAFMKGRKAKSQEELEALVVPAMEARECDDRILKWTAIPSAIACGTCLGAVFAVGIHHFVK